MLYSLSVLTAKSQPIPWDSMDGVHVFSCKSPALEPIFEEGLRGYCGEEGAQRLLAEQSKRLRIGQVPVDLSGPVTSSSDFVYLTCDGVGCVYATLVKGNVVVADEKTQWTLLTHLTWQRVGDLWLRVEVNYEPQRKWDDFVVKEMTRWQRLLNRLFRRTCGKCVSFDRTTGSGWRSMVTHSFLEGLEASMNDDITKQSAENYKVPDFAPGEFGFCPRCGLGLSARLRACREFKRRW